MGLRKIQGQKGVIMISRCVMFIFLLFLFVATGCDDDSDGSANVCAKLESACTENDVSYYQECVEEVDLCEQHGLTEQKWDMDAVGACNDSLEDCEALVECYAEATYCDVTTCNSVTLVPSDCPAGTMLLDVIHGDFETNDYYPCHSGFFSITSGDGYSIAVCYLDHCLTKAELLEDLCQ